MHTVQNYAWVTFGGTKINSYSNFFNEYFEIPSYSSNLNVKFKQ